MTPATPAVALLFDDVELGSQLREALQGRGVRIVHEGAVSGLTRELLEKVGADVLVVNLDDVADDALDNLYKAIDGTSRKVVFNDGHASRALIGWDRARWARHLALKVLEVGEIDPPRPENARDLSGVGALRSESRRPTITSLDGTRADTSRPELPLAPPQAAGAPHADSYRADVAHGDAAIPASRPGAVEQVDPAELSWAVESTPAHAESIESPMVDLTSFDDLPAAVESAGDSNASTAKEASENLAAELEALLASNDLTSDVESTAASGLGFAKDDEPPMLHDGHFGLPRGERDDADDADDDDPFAIGVETPFNEKASSTSDDEFRPSPVDPLEFELDDLELSPLMDAVSTTVHAPPGESASRSANAAITTASAPSSWSLIEDDLAPAPTPEKTSPSEFGIEKISAADFLAPAVDNADDYSELVMSFDLMSTEEAIAPKAFEDVDSIRLDNASGALEQVVLMGAAVGGVESVCAFLAAMPADTQLFFLHTQHLGDMTAETMVAKLAMHSSLPVRLATHDSRAMPGEVLLVPSGQQLRLRRDGGVALQPSDTYAAKEPSIDASLSMAAGVFRDDALAIIFAGRGNDGVAGAQAVHDRGGKVWVEALSGEHHADMVSGIVAERLVNFSGSPHELATRLIEVYP